MGKIMIVDAEQDVLEALKLHLDGQSYHFIEAENGADAVQKLKSEDNLVNVGLILCDINIAQGGRRGLRSIHPKSSARYSYGGYFRKRQHTASRIPDEYGSQRIFEKTGGERALARITVHKYISADKDISF